MDGFLICQYADQCNNTFCGHRSPHPWCEECGDGDECVMGVVPVCISANKTVQATAKVRSAGI
jgi:hypothetical protein